MPYQLVPSQPVHRDVGEALHMLLEAFKDNQLTGLSFVAFQRRGRYFTDITGSCASNPTLTRGALGELIDKASDMQHDRHHNDTR